MPSGECWFADPHPSHDRSLELCTRYEVCCVLLWFQTRWLYSNSHLSGYSGNTRKFMRSIHCGRWYEYNKTKHNQAMPILCGVYCRLHTTHRQNSDHKCSLTPHHVTWYGPQIGRLRFVKRLISIAFTYQPYDHCYCVKSQLWHNFMWFKS